jgi:hypothetical protein
VGITDFQRLVCGVVDSQGSRRSQESVFTWQLSMYPSKAVRVVSVGGAGASVEPVDGSAGDPPVPVSGVVGAGELGVGDTGVGDDGGGTTGAAVGGAGFPKISCRKGMICIRMLKRGGWLGFLLPA